MTNYFPAQRVCSKLNNKKEALCCQGELLLHTGTLQERPQEQSRLTFHPKCISGNLNLQIFVGLQQNGIKYYTNSQLNLECCTNTLYATMCWTALLH